MAEATFGRQCGDSSGLLLSRRLGNGASVPQARDQSVTTSASSQTFSRSSRTVLSSSYHTSHAAISSGESASSTCCSRSSVMFSGSKPPAVIPSRDGSALALKIGFEFRSCSVSVALSPSTPVPSVRMRRRIGKPLFVFSDLLQFRFQTLDDLRILFNVSRVGPDVGAGVAVPKINVAGCPPDTAFRNSRALALFYVRLPQEGHVRSGQAGFVTLKPASRKRISQEISAGYEGIMTNSARRAWRWHSAGGLGRSSRTSGLPPRGVGRCMPGAAFVGLLLVALVFVWINRFDKGAGLTTYQVQAEIGRTFFQTLVFTELVMVMLTAPAAAAGAICLDKARGTLLHVLVTDLSDAEIVLGKLAARVVPALGLVACSLPVLALGLLLGGIDPVALTGSFLVIVGVTVLGCALALTLSVWGKKTHEVLLATYAVWAIWVVAIPASLVVNPIARFPAWLLKTNPIGLTVAAHDSSNPASPGLGDQLLFLAAALVISAVLLALAVARLRTAIIHQWGRSEQSGSARARRRYLRGYGPTLDANPVLWREWHRHRPSRWARIIWGLYIALAAGFSVVAIHLAWQGGSQSDPAGVISGFVTSIGLLLLSVSAATSLAEERAMGSLDVLLATPLPTSTIVWGKWCGTFRNVPLLAILPGMVAVAMTHQTGRWLGPPLVVGVILAYGAAVTSLGLALATWVRRLSLALALCVGAVVGVTVGAIPVAMILFRGTGDFALCAAMASPFFGVGYFSAMIGVERPYESAAASAILWSGFYAAAASGLLAATLLTFDRCMGRIPDRPALPRLRPPARMRRQPGPVLAE